MAGPLRDLDDDALMARAKDGDRDAFGVLVVRHEARVRAFLARMVGSMDDAWDLCQDVFLEVWDRRQRYDPRGRFVAFLFTVARSRALSRLRFAKVRRLFADRRREEDAHDIASLPGPDDVVRWREREAALSRQLAGLPREQREVLLLRHVAQLEYAEIAGLLGVSEGALRVRAHRGLALLRERLPQEPEISGPMPAAAGHVQGAKG